MRAFRVSVLVGVMIATITLIAPRFAAAEDGNVKILAEWKVQSRRTEDNDLWRAMPSSGFIAGSMAWAELWTAWNGEKELPEIDFEQELILVAGGPGPNFIKIFTLELDEAGDLKFVWSITQRGGDGFVATLWKIKREGIKSVNGKELPKE